MTDVCHWVRDKDGTEYLIPMCYGSLDHPSGCTCEKERNEHERVRLKHEDELRTLRLLAAHDDMVSWRQPISEDLHQRPPSAILRFQSLLNRARSESMKWREKARHESDMARQWRHRARQAGDDGPPPRAELKAPRG